MPLRLSHALRSPSAPSKPAGLSPRTAGKENSSCGSSGHSSAMLLAAATAQAGPLQDHQPLGLLATPSAPVRSRARPLLPGLAPLAPPFVPLSRTASGAMPMEEDEVAATPAYSTAPASYSLFSGGGLGGGAALFGQPEPFGAGGSVFRSALETPTAPSGHGELHGERCCATVSGIDKTPHLCSACKMQAHREPSPQPHISSPPPTGSASLFSTPSAAFLAPPGSGLSAADATPDIAITSAHLLRAGSGAFEAQLLQASSCGEDALLAAAAAAGFPAGFPAAAFPSQVRIAKGLGGAGFAWQCAWQCARNPTIPHTQYARLPSPALQAPMPTFLAAGPTLPPQPQQSPFMAAGPLSLLPLGTASGSTAASTWPAASGSSIWGPPL